MGFLMKTDRRGFFDAHCHIDPEAIALATHAAPHENEGANLVAGRILCSVGPEEWEAVASVRKTWPGTVAAFGVHPWHVAENNRHDWLADLENRLVADADAWLGEAGLDGRRQGIASAPEQEKVFTEQLRLAARLGRPANLHCVGPWEELTACLDREYLPGRAGGAFIVHGFGGPYQYIRILAERGAYFTVGPLMAGKISRKARERAALIPEDRLLLESDAFLFPGRDATEDIQSSLAWLADVRSIPKVDLQTMLLANVGRVLHG